MEKLNDRSQWFTWLRRIEDELILMGMKDVAKGWRDRKRPLKPEHDAKALRLLRGHCGRSARRLVEQAPTFRHALCALEKEYKPHTMFDLTDICYRLDCLCPSDFPDLSTYYHKFCTVQQELRDMAPQLALPAPYLVAKFLNSLGPEYQDFKNTFLVRSRASDKPDKPAVTLHGLFMAILDWQVIMRKRLR